MTLMGLVNHASELIHQSYQREKVEVVAQWRDAVNFPCAGLEYGYVAPKFYGELTR